MSDVTLCFITFTVRSRNSDDLAMNLPPIKYNFLPICRWKEKRSPHGYCSWCLTQLGSKDTASGSSETVCLCPTTGLQSAQQDLKLPSVVIGLVKGYIGDYVVKSSRFMSSKLGNSLFLVSTSSICSRSQSSACSKNLMDDLCTAVLFSQQVCG